MKIDRPFDKVKQLGQRQTFRHITDQTNLTEAVSYRNPKQNEQCFCVLTTYYIWDFEKQNCNQERE